MPICHILGGLFPDIPPVVYLPPAVDSRNNAAVLGHKAILANQVTFGGVNGVAPGAGAYMQYIYLRDLLYMAEFDSTFFTSAYLRPLVNRFVATIGGDGVGPNAPAEAINSSNVALYRPNNNTWGQFPTFDNGPYLALLAALTYDRGDHTVYAAHNASLAQALSAAPRDGSGLIYSNPANYSVGWGYEDAQVSGNKGGLGMATALHLLAYQKMAAIATSEGDAASVVAYTAAAASLKAALGTLRRVDGYYNSCTSEPLPHVILTSMVVYYDWASPPQIAASAAALLADYNAVSAFSPVTGGNVAQRGGIRHLVYPNYFATGSTQGTYQNGGAWLGPWTGWVARALLVAGSSVKSAELLQAAVDETLREQLVPSVAPWEWSNSVGGGFGAFSYPAAADFVAFATDSAEPFTVLDSYTSNLLATDYFTIGAGWGVAAGVLTNTAGADAQTVLWKTAGTKSDGLYYADMQSATIATTRFPSLIARATADGANGIVAMLGVNRVNLFNRVAGVMTQFATGAVTTANGTPYHMEMRVKGTSVTVFIDNVPVCTGTTSVIAAGYFGPFVGSTGPSDTITFDNLGFMP